MEYLIFAILLIFIIVIAIFSKSKKKKRFDSRGFDHNRIHKNSTKYDDFGFDYYGYNSSGYNRQDVVKIIKVNMIDFLILNPAMKKAFMIQTNTPFFCPFMRVNVFRNDLE